jgi:hypothetical protein
MSKRLCGVVDAPGQLRFDGADYSPEADQERLGAQFMRIRDVMLNRPWRTLAEIEALTGDPQSSISAQLRHMRKPRFGAYVVSKRRRHEGGGTYEYHVADPGEQEGGPMKRSDALAAVEAAVKAAQEAGCTYEELQGAVGWGAFQGGSIETRDRVEAALDEADHECPDECPDPSAHEADDDSPDEDREALLALVATALEAIDSATQDLGQLKKRLGVEPVTAEEATKA